MAATPLFGSESLAERIADGGSTREETTTSESTEQGTTKEGQPASGALTEDRVKVLLSEATGQFRDTIAELKQENALLTGMVRSQQTRQQQTQPTKEQPAPRKKWLESRSKEDATKALQDDPFGTLREFLHDELEDIVAPLRTSVEQVRGTVQSDRQQQQQATELQSDVAEMTQDFGHLKDNKDFRSLADQIFDGWVANGGYKPGLMYKACAKAHQQLLREGKLATTQRSENNGTENGNGARPRLTFSSHGPANGSRGNGSEDGRGEPKTLKDLGYDDVNVRAALKIAKKWGLSEADYVKQVRAAQASDKTFGGLNANNE